MPGTGSRRDFLRRGALTLGAAIVATTTAGSDDETGASASAAVTAPATGPLVPLPRDVVDAAARAANACVAFNVADMTRRFPGRLRILDLGGATEDRIRVPAFTALGLATLLATDAYDEDVAGVDRDLARAWALRLVDSLSAAHVGVRDGGDGWGAAVPETAPLDPSAATRWQCSLWAWAVGLAGVLLWSDLSAGQRAAVTRMVTLEADRFLDYPVPYWRDRSGRLVYPGDSKSEENPWHAAVLLLAVALDPGVRARRRLDKAVELAASACSSPDDLVGDAVLHGIPLADLLRGSNVDRSGLIENHGFVNPTYMAAGGPQNALSGLVLAGTTGELPAACLHGFDRVYRALSQVRFPSPPLAPPGGTIYVARSADIYYPVSADGDPGRMATFCAFDGVAHCVGTPTPVPPATWARRHLGRQLDLQAAGVERRSNADLSAMTYVLLAHHLIASARAADRPLRVSNRPVGDLLTATGSVPLPALLAS